MQTPVTQKLFEALPPGKQIVMSAVVLFQAFLFGATFILFVASFGVGENDTYNLKGWSQTCLQAVFLVFVGKISLYMLGIGPSAYLHIMTRKDAPDGK